MTETFELECDPFWGDRCPPEAVEDDPAKDVFTPSEVAEAIGAGEDEGGTLLNVDTVDAFLSFRA